MHYCGLAFIQADADIETRLAALMAPYEETNPDGKWDWYVLGGRWPGYLTEPTGGEILPARKVPLNVLRHLPHALILPDGRWLERETWNSEREDFDRIEDRLWAETFKHALRDYADHLAVVVDYHS